MATSEKCVQASDPCLCAGPQPAVGTFEVDVTPDSGSAIDGAEEFDITVTAYLPVLQAVVTAWNPGTKVLTHNGTEQWPANATGILGAAEEVSWTTSSGNQITLADAPANTPTKGDSIRTAPAQVDTSCACNATISAKVNGTGATLLDTAIASGEWSSGVVTVSNNRVLGAFGGGLMTIEVAENVCPGRWGSDSVRYDMSIWYPFVRGTGTGGNYGEAQVECDNDVGSGPQSPYTMLEIAGGGDTTITRHCTVQNMDTANSLTVNGSKSNSYDDGMYFYIVWSRFPPNIGSAYKNWTFADQIWVAANSSGSFSKDITDKVPDHGIIYVGVVSAADWLTSWPPDPDPPRLATADVAITSLSS